MEWKDGRGKDGMERKRIGKDGRMGESRNGKGWGREGWKRSGIGRDGRRNDGMGME